MLYAYDADGKIVGKVTEGNETWRGNKEAMGFSVLHNELDFDLDGYKVQGGIIVAKDAAEILAQAKTAKQGQLLANIKRFITTKPDGLIRYDTDLKLNLMNASMAAMAAGQDYPVSVAAVKTWIQAVQERYFTLKAEIAGAVDLASLEAVDVSLETLEAEYGVAGSVAADPDVSTVDLLS